jgi:hypothetical protein
MDRIKEGVGSESKMKMIIDLIAKKCFPTLCKETRWSELCSDFAFLKTCSAREWYRPIEI